MILLLPSEASHLLTRVLQGYPPSITIQFGLGYWFHGIHGLFASRAITHLALALPPLKIEAIIIDYCLLFRTRVVTIARGEAGLVLWSLVSFLAVIFDLFVASMVVLAVKKLRSYWDIFLRFYKWWSVSGCKWVAASYFKLALRNRINIESIWNWCLIRIHQQTALLHVQFFDFNILVKIDIFNVVCNWWVTAAVIDYSWRLVRRVLIRRRPLSKPRRRLLLVIANCGIVLLPLIIQICSSYIANLALLIRHQDLLIDLKAQLLLHRIIEKVAAIPMLRCVIVILKNIAPIVLVVARLGGWILQVRPLSTRVRLAAAFIGADSVICHRVLCLQLTLAHRIFHFDLILYRHATFWPLY